MSSSKLNDAFRLLRKRGYFARQNFWCCQTCGCAAVPEDHAESYVFYHRQDAERLRKDGGTMLAWGGDGDEIVKCCLEAGLVVTWDGSKNTRIFVSTQPIKED